MNRRLLKRVWRWWQTGLWDHNDQLIYAVFSYAKAMAAKGMDASWIQAQNEKVLGKHFTNPDVLERMKPLIRLAADHPEITSTQFIQLLKGRSRLKRHLETRHGI